jgi:hypothetical protein
MIYSLYIETRKGIQYYKNEIQMRQGTEIKKKYNISFKIPY